MKVTDFRITYSAIDGVPLQMTQDCGRLGSLVRRESYASFFERVLKADDDELLTTPWPYDAGNLPSRNYYWTAYIVRQIQDHQGSSPGKLAFQSVVPMRRKSPLLQIQRARRLFAEGWFFPHGVATAITAWFRGTFDPAGMAAEAHKFLSEPLDLAWADQLSGLPARMPLKQIADAVLKELGKEAFGDAPRAQTIPYVTLTMVQAKGDDKDDASEDKQFVKAALSIVGVDPDSTISPDGSIYARGHGRVVWRRDYALNDPRSRHTLGCLHRNVWIGTMQVASLLKAADMLAAASDGQSVFGARIGQFASAVAGTLGRIHGQKAWPKQFLTDQIAKGNQQGGLSDLRVRCNMTPLH
jgi:hypothetical protein